MSRKRTGLKVVYHGYSFDEAEAAGATILATGVHKRPNSKLCVNLLKMMPEDEGY